jgi:hypothetical protein
MKATTGATLITFSVGRELANPAFDGNNIWVTIFGGTTISKM